MAAGMGTVYLLLTALVGVVHAVSRLSRKLDKTPAAASTRTFPDVDDAIVGVISAAVQMHRNRKSRGNL